MLQEEFIKESDGKTYLLLEKTKETFEEEMLRRTELTGRNSFKPSKILLVWSLQFS